MTSFRCLALLTFLYVSFGGLPYFGVTVQAQSATAKEKQEPETTPSSGADDPSTKAADESEQELIARLEKYLTGTKWTGNFIIEGKDELLKEHYEILSAEKSEFGDKWNLIARIKYGGHDTTVPLPPIEIKFAGKTPVITVDRAFIPALGTFDARVVIRQGKYAGTWKHGKKGGFLFGTIQNMSDEERAAAKKIVQKITED